MSTEKKIPQRKCIGCEEMTGKKELVRIVRSKDGEISLDPTGKKSGRGAYICKDSECLAKAIKKKAIERSFKCAVPSEVYDQLQQEMEKL